MVCSDTSKVVVLKGGTSVLLSALQLALALEERGMRLEAVGDDRLRVSPPHLLTAEDRDRIRALKFELIRIARYEAPEVA